MLVLPVLLEPALDVGLELAILLRAVLIVAAPLPPLLQGLLTSSPAEPVPDDRNCVGSFDVLGPTYEGTESLGTMLTWMTLQ